MQTVTLKRGASFIAVLDDITGNGAGAQVSAVLKAARDGAAPGDDAPAVAVFAVAYQADIDRGDGTSGPGWFLTLSEIATEALTAGRTVMTDVRIEVDGLVHYTPSQRLLCLAAVMLNFNRG